MQLTLEQAGAEHAERCVEIFRNSLIYERYFQETGRLESSLRRAADLGELYLALNGAGEYAGAMRVSLRGFCGLYPYLNLIGVRETFRGCGVGSFLLGHFERMSMESGSRRVTLMVSDFNLNAKNFYQAHGYWILGTLPDAVKAGIAESVMVKDLA